MAINRNVLKTGAAFVQFQGATFYFKGGLTISEAKETFDIDSDAFSVVDQRGKDSGVTIKGTPVGEWESLSVLFPYLSANVGSKIYGDTDKPLVVWALDGSKRTYHNAALTKMPDIRAAATETLLGDIEFSCRCKNETEPSDANSFFTQTTEVIPAHVMNVASIKTAPFTGSWSGVIPTATITDVTNASPIVVTTAAGHGMVTGDKVTISGVVGTTAANGTFVVTVVDADEFSLNGTTGNAAYVSGGACVRANSWDSFRTSEGFAISFNIALSDLPADGYGVVDQMIKSVGAECKFKPLVSQADIDSKLQIQGSLQAVQGSSLQAQGADLILTADGVVIIIYGAAAKQTGQLFQSDQLRTGELVAVATRTFTGSALNPVAFVGTAMP